MIIAKETDPIVKVRYQTGELPEVDDLISIYLWVAGINVSAQVKEVVADGFMICAESEGQRLWCSPRICSLISRALVNKK